MKIKLLQHDFFGAPPEALELIETEPRELAQGELLIEIEAAPIHAGDLYNIEGLPIMLHGGDLGGLLELSLPQIPGIEGGGRVVEVGPGCDGIWSNGKRAFLPAQCGSWRSHIIAKAEEVIPAPEGDAVQLSLMVNPITAYFALNQLMADLKPDEWLIQNCANSNVGRALVKLASLKGIRTVNIVRSEAAGAPLKDMGADVIAIDGPDVAGQVRDATGGAKIRWGLDGVAGAATARMAECICDRGTIANYGMMSGEECRVPCNLLLYRRISLIGFYAGYNLIETPREEVVHIWRHIGDMVADGTLSAAIAATYRLEDYKQAVDHAAQSGSARLGKVVFTP